MRTYSDLRALIDFNDRVAYLDLHGSVGEDTFGSKRYLNQRFYTSAQWRSVRNQVILRDNGCDLGHPDHPIFGKVLIHHLNPISIKDIVDGAECLTDLNNLVCVSEETHNRIHYGYEHPEQKLPTDRIKGDTKLW